MLCLANEEPDKSGIYRGCVVRQKNETITTCDHIKTQETAGTTKTCSSCTTDKCNTGGAASLIVSTAALIVGVAVCVLRFWSNKIFCKDFDRNKSWKEIETSQFISAKQTFSEILR